jgi:outer membrane protein OmpA-like peptidoglycan-associated protein
MFDTGKSELDPEAKRVLEGRWFDRKGARYFFVVARGSRTGTQARNRQLSHERANSVMYYIKEATKDDPELDKKVGMLWLGNEYAQLSADFCSWAVSRPGKKCDEEAINRSAFVSWVDCRL